MTESQTSPAASRLVLRLLGSLSIFLALGNLVWFVVTFPTYFRWYGHGWASPALPLFLLWSLLGLPSLTIGIVAVRLARAAGRLGFFLKTSFYLVLAVCTLVPLLASLANWNAATGDFPWLLWLVTLGIAVLLRYLALRMGGQPRT